MDCDPTRVNEIIVGLGDVEVLGVDETVGLLRVHVRRRTPRPPCWACGGPLWSHGDRRVELVDLPVFGRATRLVWHKRRWRCGAGDCGAKTVTEQDREIASRREGLTARAGRWVTAQAGRGRPLTDLAGELGCCWHVVNSSVQRWGQALLEADTQRLDGTEASGLDETLTARRGRFKSKVWSTSVVDVGRGALLDIVAGRTAKPPTQWILDQPEEWRENIRWATLDLSGPYKAAFDTALPDVAQIADPFHVVRTANQALDEVRRRIQNATLGHRGRKADPLYRARKLLLMASELINDDNRTKLLGLLKAGDPHGEVRDAWHAKEVLRSVYEINDPDTAVEFVTQLAEDLQDLDLAPEVNRLGRTLSRWSTQITNWHVARVTNAATEAANNLIKRVKRVAFGFTNFQNYRIRALLYAGKPNWNLLNTITPP